MLISDLFAETHLAITSNKVRTGLTILGIVIGIASVIVMIAIGNGSQKAIEESIQSVGSNLLTVQPGAQRSFGGGARGGGSAESLTLEDAEAIATSVDGIAAVAPSASGNEQIIANGANTQSQIYGVTNAYTEVNNLVIASGTFISETHDNKRSKVVVIGPDIRDELFGEDADVVGESMRIGGLKFTVVGVTQSKGGGGFGSSDEIVYMPLSTYQQYYAGSDYLSSISVSVDEQDHMEQAEEDIETLLLKLHGIASVDDADFNIRNQADIIEMTSSVTGTLTALLAAVAGISLIVGGIGIMNMMLTTVTERTREIGLRKSIGASQSDIQMQFLLESATLTFIGGIIGIGLGFIVSFALDYFDVTTTEVSSFSIVLSFGVSAVIGVVFGYYPARRAAKLRPIEALRYE
jgi:putative ABC transport system permease protein